MSNILGPYGLQHARLPCPSPTPRACSNSSPSNSCHPTISSSAIQNHVIFCCPLLLLPSIFPIIRVLSNESVLCIRWQKYWPQLQHQSSNEWFPLGWTGLISLQSKELSRVFPTPQFKTINSSALNFPYSPTITSICDYWKNHSFD